MSDPTNAGADDERRRHRGRDWIRFAVVMFTIAAAFNAIVGVTALANEGYFAVNEPVFGDLSMWGTLYLIVAASQAVTALLLVANRATGVFVGVLIAALSALVALVSVGAYPLWSITVAVVDGLIIYGLTMYGYVD